MTGRQIGGIVCLVLAGLLLLAGIGAMLRGNGPAFNDPSGLGVGRAVGRFLPFVVALIVGLWLVKPEESTGKRRRGGKSGRRRR